MALARAMSMKKQDLAGKLDQLVGISLGKGKGGDAFATIIDADDAELLLLELGFACKRAPPTGSRKGRGGSKATLKGKAASDRGSDDPPEHSSSSPSRRGRRRCGRRVLVRRLVGGFVVALAAANAVVGVVVASPSWSR